MEIKIGGKSKGERLDVFLSDYLSEHAPNRIKGSITRGIVGELIKQGVTVNGKGTKKSLRTTVDDLIKVDLDVLEKILVEGDLHRGLNNEIIPEKGDLNVVYEDRGWLVVNKKKGIVIHPGVGNPSRTLANFVVGYLSEKGEYDPSVKRGGVVHRLDKGVSGLVIFAKNRAAQLDLKKQFEERKVLKIYRAQVKKIADTAFTKMVQGFKEEFGVEKVIDSYLQGKEEGWEKIEGLIKRDSVDRMRMKFSGVGQSGKYSCLYIKPLSENNFLIFLKTGRMHQIRATLRYLGFVIVGDRLYGDTVVLNSDYISLECVLLRAGDKEGSLKEWRLI